MWRNRDRFLQGREEIEAFLTHKWFVESGYRLRKELFAFEGNKVRFIFSGVGGSALTRHMSCGFGGEGESGGRGDRAEKGR